MSRRASPGAIGAFVLGGIALVIGGLLVFGSGAFFEDTTTYVMYFDDSVTGLSPGAPVVFRGVEVGEVSAIKATIDADLDIQIPVLVKIGGAVEAVGPQPGRLPTREETISVLIDRGMRAQLGLQSLVTGQLHVALDFHPDRPAVFHGRGPQPEIPTIASPLTELQQRFEELPLQDIAGEVLRVLRSLEGFIGSAELRNTLRNADRMVLSLRSLAESLDQRLPALAESADDAFATFSEDSATRYALDDALLELAAAARSVRALAEYLERHPESLLSGKGSEVR